MSENFKQQKPYEQENYPISSEIIYGRFAVEREETLKKIKNELILNLDKFQHLEYFWHININLIFLEFPPFLLQSAHMYNRQCKDFVRCPPAYLLRRYQ